jgi:DNA-binding LacI/PurR family transcriptional regulator
VPVVALWQGTSPLEFPTADTDDRAGIRAGLAHLTSLGHRRIAFISSELPGEYRVREDAYVDFMRDRFGGVPSGYLERCPNTLAGGDAALRRLLDLPEPPTAVFCFTDSMAMGAYRAATERGVRIPDDFSVVGFDDHPLIASSLAPGLTTVGLPHYEMGEWAVETLLELAEGAMTGRPLQMLMPCPLVRRDSVGPPSR